MGYLPIQPLKYFCNRMSIEKKIICIVEDKSDLREAMNMMIQMSKEYALGGSYANAEVVMPMPKKQ